MKRVFVTGASGFIGSNFLLRALGQKVENAIVLSRSTAKRSAWDRVRDALHQANLACATAVDVDSILRRIEVVEGDITQANLGLSTDRFSNFQTIDEVWHLAATLNYEKFNSEGIAATNVDGTENVLSFAKQIGAGCFNYISTAYVCGRMFGGIDERVQSQRPTFNNLYEESKYDAELLVHRMASDLALPTRIIRPSIVIGNSETYRRGSTTAGLYGFVKQMFSLKRALERSTSQVRMFGDPDAMANFIPVDWVVDDLLRIMDASTAGIDVFHVTSDGGPNNYQLLEILKEELGMSNIIASPRVGADDLSSVERLIEARTAYYASYASSQKEFASQREETRILSAENLRGFVRSHANELEQEQSGNRFRKKKIYNNDHLLNVYDMGEKGREVALICNAAGMPIELVEPLALLLAERFHVITWETRLFPSVDNTPLRGQYVAVGEHVSDGLSVLASFGTASAHILGWCNGVRVALGIATSGRVPVGKLVLMSGSFGLARFAETEFERTMRAVMPAIAGNPKLAETLLRSFFAKEVSAPAASVLALGTSDTLLRTTDPELVHLIAKPFGTADSIGRYSRLIAGFAREEGADPISIGTIPTLVIVGSADISVEPSTSRRFAAEVPGATMIEIEGADHFGPATSPPFQRAVSHWLE